MLRTRAGISQQIDCATAAARSAPLSAYLVCNVEYSHLPNSARTELLHEDETSRYFAVRYCIHFSDYTHSWLQTEMRSWSVTVVVCLLCLVWRYRLRLCWSAYRRGGLLSPPLGGKWRHLVEETWTGWRRQHEWCSLVQWEVVGQVTKKQRITGYFNFKLIYFVTKLLSA